MIKLSDVLEGKFEATSLDQMIVVTRIRELFDRGDAIAKQIPEMTNELNMMRYTMRELVALLDDMPGTSLDNTPSTPDG